jgi:hypothetical protein
VRDAGVASTQASVDAVGKAGMALLVPRLGCRLRLLQMQGMRRHDDAHLCIRRHKQHRVGGLHVLQGVGAVAGAQHRLVRRRRALDAAPAGASPRRLATAIRSCSVQWIDASSMLPLYWNSIIMCSGSAISVVPSMLLIANCWFSWWSSRMPNARGAHACTDVAGCAGADFEQTQTSVQLLPKNDGTCKNTLHWTLRSHPFACSSVSKPSSSSSSCRSRRTPAP